MSLVCFMVTCPDVAPVSRKYFTTSSGLGSKQVRQRKIMEVVVQLLKDLCASRGQVNRNT